MPIAATSKAQAPAKRSYALDGIAAMIACEADGGAKRLSASADQGRGSGGTGRFPRPRKRPVREADQWRGSGGTGRFPQLQPQARIGIRFALSMAHQLYPSTITGKDFAAGGSVLDHKFGSSDPYTLGVEEEYMLLDG